MRLAQVQGQIEKEGWLLVGVLAQLQRTGSLGQRPWVQFLVPLLFFLSLCRFKGLQTVTPQIISIGPRTWWAPSVRLPTMWWSSDSFEFQTHTAIITYQQKLSSVKVLMHAFRIFFKHSRHQSLPFLLWFFLINCTHHSVRQFFASKISCTNQPQPHYFIVLARRQKNRLVHIKTIGKHFPYIQHI